MSNMDHAIEWASNGFAVFPLVPLTKLPHKDTRGFMDATSDVDEVRKLWLKHGVDSNIGMACGNNGFVVIDVDAVEHEINDRLEETWVQRTTRNRWHHVYLQPLGEPIRNVKKGVIAPDVETRGEGGYILLAPSTVKNDDGTVGEYRVHNDVPPQPCPQWLVDKIRAYESQKRKPTMSLAPSSMMARPHESWGRGRLRAIVDRLANAGEGTRNNELASCATAAGRIVGGGHLGYSEAETALWAVASKWPSHRKRQSTLKRCLDFGCTSPVYPEAREGSALDTSSAIDWDALHLVDEEEPTTITMEQPAVMEAGDVAQWKLLLRVRSLGGLCDSFAAWVMRGAVYAQPGLTVGATVALGAALGARQYTYRGCTSSMYLVALANTGEGKGRPQACLEDALSAAAPKLLGPGNIVSAKALWRALKSAADEGNGLVYVLDEYGEQLSAILQRKAGSGAELYGWLLKYATINSRRMTWGQSATDGGDIEAAMAPSLTIMGSSTPTSLHKALQGDAVDDGYMGRHLWCAGLASIGRKNRAAHLEPGLPAQAVLDIRMIWESHKAWVAGTGDKVDSDAIAVLETPEACAALEAWDDAIEDERLGRTEKRRAPNQILARALETAQRVALSLAVLRSPGGTPVIDEDVILVACAIVDASCRAIGETLARDSSRSTHERDRRDVERVVLAALETKGRISLRDVLRQCRHLERKDIYEALKRGAEEGMWQTKESPGGGGHPSVTVLPIGSIDG